MPRNDLDRRVQKTQQLLQSALIELMIENSYRAITIQQILERANVGRSTFYAHFGDKDQLLHSCLLSFETLFSQHAARFKTMGEISGSNDNPIPLSLFQFVEQNHIFFKALITQKQESLPSTIIYNSIFAQAFEHLKLMLPSEKQGSLQSEMMAHYIASAFMGILTWWVEKDMPYSAEEMGRLARQIVLPGLREVLGPLRT